MITSDDLMDAVFKLDREADVGVVNESTTTPCAGKLHEGETLLIARGRGPHGPELDDASDFNARGQPG
ncbi:MAG: hypothetical protein RL015_3886 [Verrucomicrobiota bacterium]|jgi:hypothetical protein